MDSQADLAEKELFDSEALLAKVGSHQGDAAALMKVALAEMRAILEKINLRLEAQDFDGVMSEASKLRDIAMTVCSKTMELTAERAFRMALIKSSDEISFSCMDIADCLRLLELHLRRKGWL